MLALVGGRAEAGIGTVTRYLSEWLRESELRFVLYSHQEIPFARMQHSEVILVAGNLLSVMQTLFLLRLRGLSMEARVIVYLAVEGEIPRSAASFLQQADALVVPSRWNYDLVRRVYRGELSIIPHGIDTALFHPLDPNARKYDFAIVAPSWSSHRKGLDIANRVVSETGLKVIANHYAYFHRQMKSVRPRVGLFVPENHDTMPNFYNSAKVLLYPSRSEGFGLPVLESMSCGTPVIYSDAPAHNEFAVGVPVAVCKTYSGRRDFSPFVLTYHDTDYRDYVSSLNQLMEDSAQLRELGQKARKAAERYDFRVVFEDFRNILS